MKAVDTDYPQKGFQLYLDKSALVLRFEQLWSVLSWAPYKGGLVRSQCIFNHKREHFEDEELETIFQKEIRRLKIPDDSVGLLTGADIEKYQSRLLEKNGLWVFAIATAGLSNARSVGDRADVERASSQAGTINLILICNALPKLEGQLEAVHVASMAKTKAIMEAGIKSKKSNQPATGTGTDCIVLASSGEIHENFCGMHTVMGELIGEAVQQVIQAAVEKSLQGSSS